MGARVADTSSGLETSSRWLDRAARLAKRHALPNTEDLEILLETLDGLAIRDQGLPAGDAATQQRQRVATAARGIKKHALEAIDTVAKLRASLEELDAAITVEADDGLRRWSSIMLSQVFDIPLVDPCALNVPTELHALKAMTASDQEWAERLDIIEELSNLPVRQRIPTGPVPDPVLLPALLACRNYWVNLENDWKRQDLAEREQREDAAGAQGENLRGPAERFVVDALHAADIAFDLRRLNSAWIALDAEFREAARSRRSSAEKI